MKFITHSGFVVCALSVLFLSVPVFAAQKTGTDLLGTLAWQGLAPERGYFFNWGDSPFENKSISCEHTKESDTGLIQRSQCVANSGLMPIGDFEVSSAEWYFQYSKLSSILIYVKADPEIKNDLPEKFEIINKKTSVIFLKSANGAKHSGLIILKNTDFKGFDTILADATRGIDTKNRESMAVFMDNLRTKCEDCEIVLMDYFKATDIVNSVTPLQAGEILQNSPIVTYLLALKALEPTAGRLTMYDFALDSLKTISGNFNTFKR